MQLQRSESDATGPMERPARSTAPINVIPKTTSIAVSSTIVPAIVVTVAPATRRRMIPTRSASPTRAGSTAFAPIAPANAPSVVRYRSRPSG